MTRRSKRLRSRSFPTRAGRSEKDPFGSDAGISVGRIRLTGILRGDDGRTTAIFTDGSSSYIVGIDEDVGDSGWSLQEISGDSAILTDGEQRIVVGFEGGSRLLRRIGRIFKLFVPVCLLSLLIVQTNALTYYTVQRGDYLELIAERFGVSVEAIAAANDIKDKNLIITGSSLVIPAAYSDEDAGSDADTPQVPEKGETDTGTRTGQSQVSEKMCLMWYSKGVFEYRRPAEGFPDFRKCRKADIRTCCRR